MFEILGGLVARARWTGCSTTRWTRYYWTTCCSSATPLTSCWCCRTACCTGYLLTTSTTPARPRRWASACCEFEFAVLLLSLSLARRVLSTVAAPTTTQNADCAEVELAANHDHDEQLLQRQRHFSHTLHLSLWYVTFLQISQNFCDFPFYLSSHTRLCL